MARKLGMLLVILLVAAAGFSRPAGANATYEFIQTSDPATSDGYTVQGALVISNAAYFREGAFSTGIHSSLYGPGLASNPGLAGIQAFFLQISGFGVSLSSFIPSEPPGCSAFGACTLYDLAVFPEGGTAFVALDYFDVFNYLAFNGMFGSGGAFLTLGANNCVGSPCFFDGFWQLVGPVPVGEPMSLGLLALGVAGVSVVQRRYRS